MLRDFKFLRRNSKNPNSEEIENVPVNPSDSSAPHTAEVSFRPPLNAIQEPAKNHRAGTEHEVGNKSSKADRTPTKQKGRCSDGGMQLRTPEKRGVQAGNRFGYAQKSDLSSTGVESRDDERADSSNYTGQSSRGMSNVNGGFGNLNTPRGNRTIGRTNSGYSESTLTQCTPSKSVSKPPNPGLCLTGGSRPPPASGNVRMANFNALSKGISTYGSSMTVVNTVEVPHFDLKEDPSFWMDHNIQVLIRVRPLNSMERSTNGYNRCLKQESAQCVTWIGQPETRFTFDHVACETVDQETLFRMVGLPMVENCLSGYNSCMFAYGQTGSGKTYTMLGEIDELEVRPSLHRGMTPRIFEFLFARIRAEEESRRDERLKYYCKCSFLEIYNEQITDLLDPSSTNLLLREDSKKGVYVENLSEFNVETVGDILRLLSEGSSNRRVAATNMNRESSRSHSVFTCVIESRWEKDSTSNLRFARLNLVDLAGSERQKSSGAEGERLKEAANINKSLSTLGHVIMVLVDVANAKQRHIPYRDSRLTFLLQDSLGGNSKTMIIANVSPSICCAAETLNTLKFAQRAKLIQNNAVVNEDSSGDVTALQHQIRLLKEEISALKRQHVSRSLSFSSTMIGGTGHEDERTSDIHGSLRVSSKQLKSLESTLTGALRREQMAESSIKNLEAEIEHLNRLVRQREEDSRCSKMMLKFREDKIHRMESLVSGSIPADSYLQEENNALSEEIHLLQAKVDRNPEVTRFALENIRLLEQLRRFQDFYEEGEREMLLNEVSDLRDQLATLLAGNSKQHSISNIEVPPKELVHVSRKNDYLHLELKKTADELEECRSNLNACLEKNAKLSREIDDLRASVNNIRSATHDYDGSVEVIKESILEAPSFDDQTFEAVPRERKELQETTTKHVDEEIGLQLELDILKAIIKEEKSARNEIEEKALHLTKELELAEGNVLSTKTHFEDVKKELNEAKSIIEALESQQLILITEIEELRNNNYQLLQKHELEVSSLKDQIMCQELRDPPSPEDSPLQAKLRKMQDSLEKAKRLNIWYQSGHTHNATNKVEMDEIHKEVEAETAEVIVCLQEELSVLQQQVQESNLKERETEGKLKKLEEMLDSSKLSNKILIEKLEEKEKESTLLAEEWELLTSEIEVVLTDGDGVLKDASSQLNFISGSKRNWISGQMRRMTRSISEKELIIEQLRRCLEDAEERRNEMESKLRSLGGALLVITEDNQQNCREKEKEIMQLVSQSSELKSKIRRMEEESREASSCATVAFVIVNRLSERNIDLLDVIKRMDVQLSDYEGMILQKEVKCSELEAQLSEEKKLACTMQLKLDEIEEDNIFKAKEQLTQLKTGVSTLETSMSEYVDQYESQGKDIAADENKACTGSGENQGFDNMDSKKENFECGRTLKGPNDRNDTIVLLKKEIESALESLREVRVEMAKLRDEKEKGSISEKQSQKSIESLMSLVLALQATMDNFEAQIGHKIVYLDKKLLTVEGVAQEAGSWFQEKKLYELELGDAQIIATQKAAEASCIYAKFEEAQDTMKDADIMINELLIFNETTKLEIERLKKNEAALTNERDFLLHEVQMLQIDNKHKDQHCQNLEKDFELELTEMKAVVLELEGIASQVQSTFSQDFLSLTSDFLCIKSQLHQLNLLMRSSLEDVWSDIIVKDCALSVLHLCHMGILLETVTGLNVENGFLHNGLCESNSVMSELREHNCKSRRELETCRILKGKLLTDIKNSFDRISRKDDETGILALKLTSFEKKIIDLELQEESMLQRSNYMGSELAVLIKEFNSSNMNLSVSLLAKEETLRGKEEKFAMEVFAKDLELLVLASELEQMAIRKASVEEKQAHYRSAIEEFKKHMVLIEVDAELKDLILLEKESEVSVLCKDVEVVRKQLQNSFVEINKRDLEISQLNKLNKEFAQDVKCLRSVSSSNDTLQHKLQKIESESVQLLERAKMKESALDISKQQNQSLQNKICLLEASLSKLQSELEVKDADLRTMSSLEEENELLKREVGGLKEDHFMVLQNLNDKNSENLVFQDKIISLENCIASLRTDMETANLEMNELQHHQSVLEEKLLVKTRDLEFHVDQVNTLKEDIVHLSNNMREVLPALRLNTVKCADSVEAADALGSMLNTENIYVEKMFQEIQETVEKSSMFVRELESLENLCQDLVHENSSLRMELGRKDEVLEGLLFDLSLLQESASKTQDQKVEVEELLVSLDALENELAIRSHEFDEAVAEAKILEGQLQEKLGIISTLELDLSKARTEVISLSSKNLELTADIGEILKAKMSIEEDLRERNKENESLEMEVTELGRALDQMNNLIESSKDKLDSVTCERDELYREVVVLKEELEMAQSLAQENETIAMEARQVAENTKHYADDKEEEVRLLERSIEELESTLNVLESKADIVKGEAERQRLQREDLELELQAVKQQLLHVKSSSDSEMKRHLDEKEKNLQESLHRIQILERELTAKDAEITQCKSHILELNLHSEAQACEYKQKFKALEALADQVKPECPAATHSTNPSNINKLEKNGSKSRGSGSPFKCMGLGLAQQIKSERDEELSAGRQRIEELEALAANRQKEIFMLNARLAAAESMTHDVIRDLLGLKLDMTNYASLLDNQQVQKIAEKARLHNAEANVKDDEVAKLKQQLNAFVEERKGWLEEIERKQAEMVAAEIALEKHRQRDRLLTTENEMFKMENVNHKKRVIELEAEIKKLSGQQNLQQRIHHHAKIKEENNMLMRHNEELRIKLRRTEGILLRVQEELANFRTAKGRSPFINFDEEQRLNEKLKEAEDERLQLAQKLVGLCTSILKAAGVTSPETQISISVAEESLEQLKNRVKSLERELKDAKFENRISNERIRLSELKPQSSPKSADENQSPNMFIQTPVLSTLDR